MLKKIQGTYRKETMHFLSPPISPKGVMRSHPAMKTIIADSWRPRLWWSSRWNYLRLSHFHQETETKGPYRPKTDNICILCNYHKLRYDWRHLRGEPGEVFISSVQTVLVSRLYVVKSVFASRLNTSPIKHHQQGAGCHASGQEINHYV